MTHCKTVQDHEPVCEKSPINHLRFSHTKAFLMKADRGNVAVIFHMPVGANVAVLL